MSEEPHQDSRISGPYRWYLFPVLAIPIAVLIMGYIGLFIGSRPTWDGGVEGPVRSLIDRLQVMFLFAILIERSVEVYLGATCQNGPDRHDPDTDRTRPSGAQPAAIAAITLGVLLALVGVRALEAIGTVSTGHWLADAIWMGADIAISAGLLAGGASLFHEVVETLRGGIKSIDHRISPYAQGGAVRHGGRPVSTAQQYTLTIYRGPEDTGELQFNHGDLAVQARCWWRADRRISQGLYQGCSKTRMAGKTDSVTGEKRPAIFLPTAVAPDTGNNTVFIHEGSGPT